MQCTTEQIVEIGSGGVICISHVADLLTFCCGAGVLRSGALRCELHRYGARFLIGSTGARRDVPLSPTAVRLFKRFAEGKGADAGLFLRDDGRLWARTATGTSRYARRPKPRSWPPNLILACAGTRWWRNSPVRRCRCSTTIKDTWWLHAARAKLAQVRLT